MTVKREERCWYLSELGEGFPDKVILEQRPEEEKRLTIKTSEGGFFSKRKSRYKVRLWCEWPVGASCKEVCVTEVGVSSRVKEDEAHSSERS